MAHDVVVIGAGLSGLCVAILLAETGQRVLVLEQHTIPGGYLQQFKRKETVFDVGFHYMGSTEPGRPLRQMFEHLGVWHRLGIQPFPDDAAIEYRCGDRSFAFPSGFDAFRDKARATWPHEVDALDAFCALIEDTCAQFKWFALKRGRSYQHPLDMKLSDRSLGALLDERFDDPWLREVLGVQSFNLGLWPHEIPWVKHVMAFRSNFDRTCRVDGGGGAIVDALVARGRELGVEYRMRCAVTGVECADRNVVAVTTSRGDRHAAERFIAACHPKPILRAIDDRDLRPMFKERVLSMRDSRGAVQVFLRLRAPSRHLDDTCVMLRVPEEEALDPPLGAVLVTAPNHETVDRGGPRLEAMTYLDESPFAAWADRPLMRRGDDYERLKGDLADRIVRMIARIAPDVPDLVTDVYAATPLTDRSYTWNEHGGVFGISHDVTQQGSNRPMPRTRLRNLFFSGHSITMPGICGTVINAFDTCALLRGDDTLFEAICT